MTHHHTVSGGVLEGQYSYLLASANMFDGRRKSLKFTLKINQNDNYWFGFVVRFTNDDIFHEHECSGLTEALWVYDREELPL